MAQVITIAGEQLFALKAQNNEQLDIDTFIFANVPGQDPNAPINRNEGLPPVGQQVHTQIVQQVGRVNDNVVIYSTVMDSLTGPFEFNWAGLYSSVNQTLIAISHIPTVQKTVTVPGAAGNTLNRNFGIEYSGIADLTGITVAPETWQLDYTARLNGMDELTRQLAADMNGKDWFIGDGFKVVPRSTLNTFKVTAGAGYVSGLRVELAADHILTPSSYPQFVYVDAWFDGTTGSQWKGQTAFTVTNTEMDDYIDANGKQHYVFKLARITAADAVTDLRTVDGLAQKVDNYINSSGVFQLFMGKLAGNRGDIKIQVLGDSTGNETYEWPYKILSALAEKYPEYTVVYKLWDNETSGYFADVVIQDGSGPNTIIMCNGSFPGAESTHFLGARKEPVKAGFNNFDLVFLNFGHNGGTAQSLTQVRNRHMTAYAQYIHNYPGTDIVCIIQNINTGFLDYSYAMASGISQVAKALNLGTIDVYKLWSDKLRRDGTVSEWMGDSIHPNSLGHDQITKVIVGGMMHTGAKESVAANDVFSKRTKNLLKNGWFNEWSSEIPKAFRVSNSTVERDLENYETGLYSAKVTATGASPYLSQIVTEAAFFIKDSVFFAARVFVPDSAVGSSAGLVTLLTEDGVSQGTSLQASKGGWQWSCAYLSADQVKNAETITVYIYAGQAGDFVLVDRCILGSGLLPSDVELDGRLPELTQYYNAANTNAGTAEIITDGNNVEVNTEAAFASFYVNVFVLEVGEKYQVTWDTSNTGNLLIRENVNDSGNFETVSLAEGSAIFDAVNYGQSLSFRAGTGQTTLNINNIQITKV